MPKHRTYHHRELRQRILAISTDELIRLRGKSRKGGLSESDIEKLKTLADIYRDISKTPDGGPEPQHDQPLTAEELAAVLKK